MFRLNLIDRLTYKLLYIPMFSIVFRYKAVQLEGHVPVKMGDIKYILSGGHRRNV